MQTVLITGSKSLLGQALYYELHGSYPLILTYHRDKPSFAPESRRCDLDITDQNHVNAIIAQTRPTTIIHLASYSDIDYCEKNQAAAHALNVEGTRHIVDAIKQLPQTTIIFISSAMVFADQEHATETTQPQPLNYYGTTKRAAEEIIQQNNNPWLIIRPTTLYGWQPAGARSNPVTWMLQKLQKRKQLTLADNYYTNPLWAPIAAHAIGLLIKENKHGIYHLGGSETLSRYALGQQVARVFKYPQHHIQSAPMESFHLVRRPRHVVLATDKLQKATSIQLPSIRESLESMKKSK